MKKRTIVVPRERSWCILSAVTFFCCTLLSLFYYFTGQPEAMIGMTVAGFGAFFGFFYRSRSYTLDEEKITFYSIRKKVIQEVKWSEIRQFTYANLGFENFHLIISTRKYAAFTQGNAALIVLWATLHPRTVKLIPVSKQFFQSGNFEAAKGFMEEAHNSED